jgi:hypothetical protein
MWDHHALNDTYRSRPILYAGSTSRRHQNAERTHLIPVLTPHAFRRGGAVAATLREAPSRLVQVWGGWSNIRMVELYTRAMQDDPATMEQFKRFSPLGSVANGRGWLTALQRALADGAPEQPGKRRLRRGVVPPGRAIRWAGRSGGPAG